MPNTIKLGAKKPANSIPIFFTVLKKSFKFKYKQKKRSIMF